MKKLLALLFVGYLSAGLAHAQYDNYAVGFKLGEPTGINIRKYFNNLNAIDVSVGTFGGIFFNKRGYREGVYKNVGLAIQVHYLWHTPLFSSEELHAYYGFGGQINLRKYYDNTYPDVPQKNASVGPSGLVGLEYFMPDGRLSFFLEGGTYIELLPDVFFTSPNVSIGVRLNL